MSKSTGSLLPDRGRRRRSSTPGRALLPAVDPLPQPDRVLDERLRGQRRLRAAATRRSSVARRLGRRARRRRGRAGALARARSPRRTRRFHRGDGRRLQHRRRPRAPVRPGPRRQPGARRGGGGRGPERRPGSCSGSAGSSACSGGSRPRRPGTETFWPWSSVVRRPVSPRTGRRLTRSGTSWPRSGWWSRTPRRAPRSSARASRGPRSSGQPVPGLPYVYFAVDPQRDRGVASFMDLGAQESETSGITRIPSRSLRRTWRRSVFVWL